MDWFLRDAVFTERSFRTDYDTSYILLYILPIYILPIYYSLVF